MIPKLNMDMPIHKRLQVIIKYQGYKIKSIAEKAGYNEKNFYRMLSGHGKIGVDDLSRISKAINVPITEFFKED